MAILANVELILKIALQKHLYLHIYMYRVLKEKLLDLTLHENRMALLSHLAWHFLHDLISMI